MPIAHISYPGAASTSSIADDLALLTPINPSTVASATSLLDVSNLGRMSAMSVSSPALAADLVGGLGLWSKLGRRRTRGADSSTRLLEDGLQASSDTFTTQLSVPVSQAWGRVQGC